MIRLPINGLSNGVHPVEVRVECTQVEGIFLEFIGEVDVRGTLTKTGKKLIFDLVARGTARLVCDYSLELFDEEIVAPFTLSYLQDTELFLRQPDQRRRIEDDPYALRLLREDDTFVDITADVAEELSVRLPIKRVAPQYRHMTFAEYARKYLNGVVHVVEEEQTPRHSAWAAALEQLRKRLDG